MSDLKRPGPTNRIGDLKDSRRRYRKPRLRTSDAFEKLVLASCVIPDDSEVGQCVSAE